MNKRLLSMFLVLCMVLTMLPVSAMAQETHRIIGGGGEIIAFASLAQTEKTVTVGTFLEDLELPETLTATVRTNFGFGMQADTNQQTVTDSVYEVILVDIPVTWTSQPEYDMDTEGEYVFTPVIEGYTVSAQLPEITVMVEAVMVQGMIAPLSAIGYDIWVGDTRVTSANAGDVLGDGRVSYTPAAEGTIQTLTLNGANITTAFMGSDSKYGIYAGDSLNLVLEGNSTVGGSSSLDTNLTTSIGVNVFGDLNISGTGSITVTGGNASFFSRGIVVSNFTVSGGNVTAIGGNAEMDSRGISVTNFTVSGGNVTATGNNNGINVMSNFILSGGNVTATSGIRAINKAPDLRGVQGTASTSYDGSSPVAYDAANIATYKYLKFEPSSGVTEQFTLLPGGTYYFDLSGEKNNIGTANTALPDTTLHYVPFTYAGTVNAYSLTSQRVTNKAYATANKSDRSLFVGDYNIGTNISWDSLNTANLIFGKTFDTNYKLRSLSAGSNKTGTASDGSDYIGQPNTNEWDQILTKSGSANNTTGWIKNWSGRKSWGQDTATSAPSLRAVRGDTSAHFWTFASSSSAYSGCGFRPALEVLNPDTLTSDGLKAVTLKLNGGKLKESAADIQIICAGSSFTAPSSEGLTAPAGKVFSGWKDTSGTTYAAGTTVPNTVTGLTAQWAVPPGALIGTASISNTAPRIGDALNGSLESDNNTGTLTYVWKVDGTQVGTGTSYTVAVGDLGKTITLEIRSSVETGTITSATTAAVAKKIAPPAPTAPTLATKTYNTVTLTANGAYEFSKDSTTWQSSNVFSGLTASTDYTFYQRVAETPDRESSAASTGLSVTTDAPPPSALIGTATISNTAPRIGDALNGSLVSGNNSGTLSYVWKADGTQVGTEESYTVAVGDLGKTITLEIRSSVETGTITSAATAAVLKKAAPSAPAAPTLASKTHNTVTLTANGAYEFSEGGSTWQSSNVFSGLNTSTAYTFYQRVAETPDRESSAASTGLSVTTNSNDGGASAPSGGGGGNASDNNSSVIVILPPPDMPNSPTQGETKVLGTVDDKGSVTVNITGKTVTDAFEKALADAKKNGYEQNGITVVLRIDTGSKTGSNVAVNLSKTVQDTILAKKIVNIIVVIDNPDISIGMDLATVEKINQQAKSDVNITATPTDSHKLTEEAKKAIGSRPVFDLKVNYGSGQQVQSFGSGSVSVAIPYTLSANEKAENVQAVYVDSNGKVHWLANSVYDSVEKVLRFSTNHFSTYGVGYKQTIVESTDEFTTAFTDIESHWAKEHIEFVVSRGLFSGTSATTFSPNTAMTRGMFVTALGKLANTDVSGYKQSSFNDVTSNAYYMGYIEWASQNSISKGTGNGTFAPDQSITREQMAVIMQNYAKVMGFTMPKVHGENTFADNAKISAYAKDAVKQMQMAGVIGGKNDNLFDPQGTATRAEVSTVLRRLMELWDFQRHHVKPKEEWLQDE